MYTAMAFMEPMVHVVTTLVEFLGACFVKVDVVRNDQKEYISYAFDYSLISISPLYLGSSFNITIIPITSTSHVLLRKVQT